MELFADEDKRYYRDLLAKLVAAPSVAAQHRGGEQALAILEAALSDIGFTQRRLPAAVNPVLWAERQGASPRRLLVYDHYDVQPEDPIAEWTSPPFELTERDGLLIGRGVSDNKGELALRITVLRAILRERGELPLTVRFLVEGEEEIGSVSLAGVVAEHPDLFAADACVWEFGGRNPDGRPDLILGLKGMCYLELRLVTADVDLHSSLAPIVPNPAWRLVHALATMRDLEGRILIPDVVAGIEAPSARDRELGALLPDPRPELREVAGVRTFRDAQDLNDVLLFEPTCTICGLESGYLGEGSKTVLPKSARAKLDFRLVPGQDPTRVRDAVRRHLDEHGFSDIEVRQLSGEFAFRSDVAHPAVETIVTVMREVYGAEPVVRPTSPGSGPMHPIGRLGMPILAFGSGYYGSRAHAPDENIRLEDVDLAAETFGRLVLKLAST